MFFMKDFVCFLLKIVARVSNSSFLCYLFIPPHFYFSFLVTVPTVRAKKRGFCFCSHARSEEAISQRSHPFLPVCDLVAAAARANGLKAPADQHSQVS